VWINFQSRSTPEIIPEVFAGQGQLTVAASALVLDATTI
jgi:hypothetical protein